MAQSKGPLGQRFNAAHAEIHADTPTTSPDEIEMLRTLLEQVYRGASLSPADKIRAILQGSHQNFAQLVRNFSLQLIQYRKLPELDTIIMDTDIHPNDKRWVPNTRRLAENTLHQGVAADLEAVIPRGHRDVRDEVLSVLAPFIEERERDRLAEQERQRQALMAQLFQGGVTIGPGMPVPHGPQPLPAAQP